MGLDLLRMDLDRLNLPNLHFANTATALDRHEIGDKRPAHTVALCQVAEQVHILDHTLQRRMNPQIRSLERLQAALG